MLFFSTSSAYARQGSLDDSVTVQLSRTTAQKVIEVLQLQSSHHFSYAQEQLQGIGIAKIDFVRSPLKTVLYWLRENYNLEFVVSDKNISVKLAATSRSGEKSRSAENARNRVSGRIVDFETGDPLQGAAVSFRVKTGNAGTVVTDEFGYFSQVVDTENYQGVITVSMTGYHQKELSAPLNQQVLVKLSRKVQELDQVVVVGYGTQKKINLTGSVASVTGRELENRPATNPAVGLQGLLPGVDISSTSGQPGSAGVSIRIRGVNTLNSSNSPLVLIDGVEGDLTMLNADDIESVTVLKDAASSAIYGARAATGVLLVTTKKGGRDKKPTVNYSGYAGIQKPTALPELVNGRQYMELYNEALSNAGLAPVFLESAFTNYDQKLDPNNYSNTNWIDEVYKKSAFQQNHTLNVDGGGAHSGYHLSYGYLDQGGLVVGDPYNSKRHNFRARVNTELFDRLLLDGNVSYSNYYRHDAAASDASGVFRLAQRISPLLPVMWQQQDGSGNWVPTDYYSYGSVNNPVDVAYHSGYYTYRSSIPTANVSATLKLIKGLDFSAQYAYRETFGEAKEYNTPIYKYDDEGNEHPSNASIKNSISLSSSREIYQNYTNTLTYSKGIQKHDFKLMGGYSQEWQFARSLGGSRTRILDGTEVLDNGSEEIKNSGTESNWALRSWFGRFNYNYDEKYLLEANVRRDGSSRFSKVNRWGTFPSFSVGWNLAKESFMDFASPVLQQFKLRASYGTLGNQNVGDLFPYLTPISSVAMAYPIGLSNNLGYYQSSIGNYNIHWETVEMSNIGVDLQLFNSRFALTADWFIKNNKDALLKPVYPAIIGSTSAAALPYANVGKVQSKGWELTASWKDQAGEIGYGLDFMLSDVKNTVKSLGNTEPSLGNNIFRVGDPLNAYFGYRTDGLAQAEDFESFDAGTQRYVGPKFATISSYTAITQPGDIKYRDISGPDGKPDGIIDDHDKVVIGNPYPRYTYSLRGNLNWKGIDFSIFLQGVYKVDGYLFDEAIHTFINDYSVPQKTHLDRWTPTNTDGSYPRLYYAQTHNREFSDYWIQNGSYLRIKNIQLGYTFNPRLLEKAHIAKMRVYVSGQNLFTATDYFYAYDPERRSTSGDSYPQVKTYAFGVNLSFK